jgi:hypothetical protein
LQRHILLLFLKGQRLIIDPLSIITLDIITTQAAGTIRTLAMALEECIFMHSAGQAAVITKSTLDINTPIQQLSALFMQELNTYMRGVLFLGIPQEDTEP